MFERNRYRNRYRRARRIVQFSILLAFVAGPWLGISIARGTLASSVWFDTVPLSDPFVLLQSMLAGHRPAIAALVGGALVVLLYAVVGGRSFCGWVCPINVVTDAARGARRALGWRKAGVLRIDRRLRYFVLFFSLAGSFLGGVLVWELVNPITMTLRALVFGLWTGGLIAVVGIFLFDFFLLSNGWCGHVCPVGAFYGAIGKASVVHVAAVERSACTGCGECFRHCPEPQVIGPALHGVDGHDIYIRDVDCLRCGRCIDVCDAEVLAFRSSLRSGRVAENASPSSAR